MPGESVYGNISCKGEKREEALGILLWSVTLYLHCEMTVLICIVGLYKGTCS